jgi:hypothetical protein
MFFLTEANVEICVPQSFDDNPEYEEMYHRQIERERILASLAKKSQFKGPHFDPEMLHAKMLHEMSRAALTDQRQHDQKAQKRLQLLKLSQEKEQKDRLERRQNQMSVKLGFDLPPEEYYADTPLQPGLSFFISLITHPRVSELEVNLPNSLFIKDKVYWVRTQAGRLTVSPDFQPVEFYDSLTAKHKAAPAIMRTPSSLAEFAPEFLDCRKLHDKLFKSQLPSSGIIQEFIENTGRVLCTTRLLLVLDTRDNKSSCAYAITNNSLTSKLKHQQYSDTPDSLAVYALSGPALAKVEAQGRRLLEFVHKSYFVRINEIVIDFVKDREGVYWIVNVRGFKLDESIMLARELRMNDERDLSLTARQEFRRSKREERLSSMTCKMCMLSYKTLEMDKVLPFKMLLLYKQHTHRSGRTAMDLSHLRVLAVDFLSHWVRLCSICYLLVIHEYELMETESQLAGYMNVLVKPPDVMAKLNYEHPAFLPTTLPQWRILLYFKSLAFTQPQLASVKPLYIHYRIFDLTFSFSIHQEWLDGGSASFSIVRLYYFFASLGHPVTKFCRKAAVAFRLTRGPDWENCIASGTSHLLRGFTGEMCEQSASYEPTQVLLFRGQDEAARLSLVAGIACDRQVKIRELPITITKMHKLYLPEESYFSSDPLPSLWLEMFDSEYPLSQSMTVLESSQELDTNYLPLLSNNEIISQPLGNTKILHVNFDLNPEATLRRALTSRRSSLQRALSVPELKVSSPKQASSLNAVPPVPPPIPAVSSVLPTLTVSVVRPLVNSRRKSSSSSSLGSQSMRTFSLPSKTETAASLTSPKSINEVFQSVSQFLAKSNVAAMANTSRSEPVSGKLQSISTQTLPRSRGRSLTSTPLLYDQPSAHLKTQESLKSCKTSLGRPRVKPAYKADKFDRQLRLIGLYAEDDWKGLRPTRRLKSRKRSLL